MEAENLASQPVMVRRLGPAVMPRAMEKASEKTLVWKRAAAVAAAGVLFGFAASLWLETPKAQRGVPTGSNPRQTSVLIIPAESAPVKQTVDHSAEVERLKTRNRRLEALVQVLQQRAEAGNRNPSPKIKN
jgi:hypothetical protein